MRGCKAAKPYFFSTSCAKLIVVFSRPFSGNVSQILAPVVSELPFVPAMGPKGVPERRPLPAGRGGGASFWRAGLEGGVGALELEGVAELVLAMGTEAAFGGSESISIGADSDGAVV